MGQFDVSGLSTTDKINFTVDWDGAASTYQITGLSKNNSIDDVVVKLNAATATAGAAGALNSKGTASVENGRIVFTAKTAGAAHTVKVYDVSNTNPYAGSAGIQASGTVFGQDAVASANGTISNADQYARVLNAAMGQAGVSGVTASMSGGKLSISSVNAGSSASVAVSGLVASAGANAISLDKLDISTSGLAAVGADSGDKIKTVLSAYISLVNTAINKVTTAASNLGSVASRIDMQKSFVNTLMDTIDKGVGNLIDADMTEESTKLQALQVKQQLGTQSLSIANQSAQSVLSLFRS
ncbi:hypothetical protein M673_15590 [Aureimonas sp. AU20]|nr:flagellin [Aureimonas sp. AU20]ALN74150.1 hypothetical protein M673_15590 [Aureimonas sp. AU20]